MSSFPTFSQRTQKIEALKDIFIDIAKKEGQPLYIFDKEEVQKNYQRFQQSFQAEDLGVEVYYAIKSNYYLGLLETVVQEGGYLDASSKRELELALKAKSKKIIYTGPAKGVKDFELILQHADRITVNLESLRELKLLAKMAQEQKKTIRCGARVYTKSQRDWTKFGMPLEQYRSFFEEAKKYPSIHFCGLHFHISLNQTPSPYVETMEEVALYFKSHFTPEERSNIEYIDMGGGIYPQHFEGLHSWNPDQVMHFKNDLSKMIADINEGKFKNRFIPFKTEPIEVFAQAITKAFKQHITPLLPNAKLYCEPGRFISHSSMHMLFCLMDVKNDHMGIVDAGNNMIGWEKYQFFSYVPFFNLSQFTTEKERAFLTYGSLCTPDDIWGYSLFTSGQPKEGDIFCLPFQGAYTYTLAQEFIKDIPDVFEI